MEDVWQLLLGIVMSRSIFPFVHFFFFYRTWLISVELFSKMKAYLCTCDVGFGGLTVSQHPPICRYMKGWLFPVSRALVPPWDLAVVLKGLKSLLFEPLQGAELKFSDVAAKCVRDIHELSVHPLCAQLFADGTRMILNPNSASVPTVIGSRSPIVFTSAPAVKRLFLCCEVHMVGTYVDKTQDLRKSDQQACHEAAPLPLVGGGDHFGLFWFGFAASRALAMIGACKISCLAMQELRHPIVRHQAKYYERELTCSGPFTLFSITLPFISP